MTCAQFARHVMAHRAYAVADLEEPALLAGTSRRDVSEPT
jgi:hypothetical protein